MIDTTNFLTWIQSFLFGIVLVVHIHGGDSKFAGNCPESERMALLQLKAELVDDYGRLSSWGSFTNCCEWNGVVCDNRTNHVVALDLHGHPSDDSEYYYGYAAADPLRGKISPSLLQLPHLQYLDLSLNDFNETTIPSFIGSFTKLHHLNLSCSNFGGHIPHHIGNLSVLRLLDLSFNVYLTDTNLDWLAGCPSLQYLDLSWANLETSSTWLQVIHKLTALKELHLFWCYLPTPISVPSHNASNSLLVLQLSSNDISFSTAVFQSVLNMSISFTYIDFSGNYFPNGRIPHDFGNLISLSHLDLHYSRLKSSIPNALANLTSLSYLDLSHNELQGEFPQPSQNTSSFTYLDLSWNRLNGQLPRILTWLHDSTRIKYLSLRDNLLSGSFPNMSRFTHLEELYLGNNGLSGALLEGNVRLPNLSTCQPLRVLDLSNNAFNGSLSESIEHLSKIEYLDLSKNKFEGRLPDLSTCQPLRVLDLSDNAFNGSLSESIEHLSKLESLRVGYNRFESVFNLSNHPHLRILDLSFNLNLTLTTTPSWIHPIQFQWLLLADCKLGPYFPTWFQNQNQLEFLDISNSGIIDTIPAWFWGNIYECQDLNMSHNQIYGVLPDLSSKFKQLMTIDLSSNEFNGSLPHLPHLFNLPEIVYNIDLSRNRFSGTLLDFCTFKDIELLLDLSNNQLSGEIPQDCFMNLLSLAYLNLANNNFSGEIPTTNNSRCSVWSLYLRNNNFSGEIPTTNNSRCSVWSLHLRNNRFRGEIPRSLMNCNGLSILDLGGNELSGKIPRWLGQSMPKLGVLILKSNMLSGSLPTSICHLANIQVLDISWNKITGTIPRCMDNFTLLSSDIFSDSWSSMFSSYRNGSNNQNFYDGASVIWKGHEETYIKTLGLLKMIDLSSNELSGVIPHEITSLIGLVGLNLSGNNLVGLIPKDIDKMKVLNFLDLSRNNLSGSIPPTLSKLSHLGVLDLSFNNLSGRIPWDTHMQTFEASSYFGNPRLCGPPLLSRPCPGDEKPSDGRSDDSEDSEEKFIDRGFYISLLLGFVVAFWVVFWSLYFNKWWNVRICLTLADWLYVHILVNKRRLMMRFLGNAS